MEPGGEGNRRSVNAGAVLAAIGGAMAVAGTFFELASVKYALDARNTLRLSSTYFDTDNGKIVAAVGVVVLVVALVTLIWHISGGITAIVLAGGGLAVFGFALYDRFDLSSKFGHLTFGPALYVVMAGGLMAAVGGVLASREE